MCEAYSVPVLAFIMIVFLLASTIVPLATNRLNYALDQETTNWVLLGGLTDSSVDFRVRSDIEENWDRLVIATDRSMANVVEEFEKDDITSSTANSTSTSTVFVDQVSATGLDPSTRYYYATLNESGATLASGSFRTAPTAGSRGPFQFVASGCSWSGSMHSVYNTIHNSFPEALFFSHLGDVHYGDLDTPDLETRIRALDNVMASEGQRTMYGNLPLVYMWDDHDWLGNNKGAEFGTPGREAALESYQQAMPYYSPLPSTAAMYHAFTIGTVRFIVTDLRSEATEDQIYSDEQKAWFFNELSLAGEYDFVVWMTTRPWIGEADEDSDTWSGYSEDRQELSEHITSVVPNNLIAIGADSHMVALDNGANTHYGQTSSGAKSFPILQTGPLDRMGSFKGGPFTEGCHAYQFERNHQYSVIDFYEDERTNNACLDVKAYRMRTQILSKRFCGDDIWEQSNPGEGSCTRKLVSPLNLALVILSLLLIVAAIRLVCQTIENKAVAILASVMVLIVGLFTFLAGIAVPTLFQKIAQYDTFRAALITVVGMASAVIYLGCWKRTKQAKRLIHG